MSDTPRTDDAFDALSRQACGTAYVRVIMQVLERENTALREEIESVRKGSAKVCWELRAALAAQGGAK